MTWRSPFGLLLTASLALNLFAVGVLAGRFVLFEETAAPSQPLLASRELTIGELVRTLPMAERARAEELIGARRDDIIQRLQALAEARDEAAASMGAAGFDRKRVEAALAMLRKRNLELESRLHEIVAGIAAGLPLEERRRIATAVLLQSSAAAEESTLLLGVPLL